MKKQDVLEILRAVESGRLGAEEAFTKLKLAPFEDIGFAKVDHHREMRQGVAEVIYGAGKTPEQIAKIGAALMAGGAHNPHGARSGGVCGGEIPACIR